MCLAESNGLVLAGGMWMCCSCGGGNSLTHDVCTACGYDLTSCENATTVDLLPTRANRKSDVLPARSSEALRDSRSTAC